MKTFLVALRMLLWMTLLTGVIYPLFITAIAQWTMRDKANGGLVTVQGKVVGAALIGQGFVTEKYFWPRPSAVDYNGLSSGGSNLGPTSAVLKTLVASRKALIARAHGLTDTSKIPSELLFASASGLDPHISPSTALFQVSRVVKARKWDTEKGSHALNQLVHTLTEPRCLGIIGEPCVNVLRLNLAVDQLSEADLK